MEGDLRELKKLKNTRGWQVFSERLDDVSADAMEYYAGATEPQEFWYRKGFLDGHLRTRAQINVLISQGEIGDQEWAQQQLQNLMEPFRTLALSQEEAPRLRVSQEQAERVRQVLEQASRQQQ